MLAHGAVLRKNIFSAATLVAIVKDFRNAGLPADEVAMMSLAQKVVTHANQVTKQEIEELHKYGLTDEEILDVILTSAARSFFSQTLDAVGATPDEIYLELEPELLEVLSLGRPFLKGT